MGQEKSLPDCCNYKREHKDSTKSNSRKTFSHSKYANRTFPPLPAPHHSSNTQYSNSEIRDLNCLAASKSYSLKHTSTSSTISSLSKQSKDTQKDYLEHHLYIKSYLDILDEDNKAKKKFKPARPGIRNYTPKILSNQQKSREQNEIWI